MSTSGPPIVIPVPLSARRQQERGFNQAAVIATVIARSGNLLLDENSLVRKIHTPMHRAGMDRKARAMTVKKAFEVVRPKLIEGRDTLLVDDVLTSGETASICARVLKKSGAATVSVLTIARAA
ncbi:MAG: ComF family protein [Blastocatellia bacterium]|nr:ComF family protein [Blastocatellia bacterium]